MEISMQTVSSPDSEVVEAPPKKPTRKPRKVPLIKALETAVPILEGDYPLLKKPKTNKEKFELVVKWIETLQKKPYSASSLIYALRELFNVHPPKEDEGPSGVSQKRPSSFNVEYQVDPVLGKVLGMEEKEMITRSELLKKTYALLRHTKNVDGQYEIEGTELADVFGKDPITYTQLQKLVSKYVLKPTPKSEASPPDLEEVFEVSME